MVQVIAFDEEHEDDLSEAINDFLINHEEVQVLDIKFSTATYAQEDEEETEMIYSFSALLIYSS